MSTEFSNVQQEGEVGDAAKLQWLGLQFRQNTQNSRVSSLHHTGPHGNYSGLARLGPSVTTTIGLQQHVCMYPLHCIYMSLTQKQFSFLRICLNSGIDQPPDTQTDCHHHIGRYFTMPPMYLCARSIVCGGVSQLDFHSPWVSLEALQQSTQGGLGYASKMACQDRP